MRKAVYSDKALVVDILTKAFDKNVSVNFIVKQDSRRNTRIRFLMEYAFETCFYQGVIYLSHDGKGCILCTLPEKRGSLWRSIVSDMKLLFQVIGINRISTVLARNRIVKSHSLAKSSLHILFIGVSPETQSKGIGSELLSELAKMHSGPIYLETSMEENLTFYIKNGFEVYNQIHEPHTVFFIRKLA